MSDEVTIEKEMIKELVYVGAIENLKDLKKFIETEWPDNKKLLTEHCDDVHEYRLAIEIDVDESEFYTKMIFEGWGPIMFGLRMMIYSGDKETLDKIRGWFKTAKDENEQSVV